MENKKTIQKQVGKSITCDFRKNTWTFEMPKGFYFTGGHFLIIPVDSESATCEYEIKMPDFIEIKG